MEYYDELIKSLEHSGDKAEDAILKKAASAISTLQEDVEEKQKLLNLSIEDLAESVDCKYCANINDCSPHQIERNLAYGGCIKWMWRGVRAAVKEVGLPAGKH